MAALVLLSYLHAAELRAQSHACHIHSAVCVPLGLLKHHFLFEDNAQTPFQRLKQSDELLTIWQWKIH
jgi:hypothetical protein